MNLADWELVFEVEVFEVPPGRVEVVEHFRQGDCVHSSLASVQGQVNHARPEKMIILKLKYSPQKRSIIFFDIIIFLLMSTASKSSLWIDLIPPLTVQQTKLVPKCKAKIVLRSKVTMVRTQKYVWYVGFLNLLIDKKCT